MPEKIVSEDEIEEVEKDQFLVFSIDSQEYAIQAMNVQEISRIMPTTKIPNAPSYIEGIMNLRGKLGSVINFRRKFRFAEIESDEDTRLIIVERTNFPTGIIVDSVAEVIRIPEETVQPMPENSRTKVVEDYVKGVGMLEKRLIILLDVNKMFDSDVVETEAIKEAIGDIQNMKKQTNEPEIKEPEIKELKVKRKVTRTKREK